MTVSVLLPRSTDVHSVPREPEPRPPRTPTDLGLSIALALTAERGWPDDWRPVPEHDGIACAIIDAVMSPHVRSRTVAEVIERYVQHHGALDGPDELCRSFHEHGRHWPDVIGTRNRAWRSTDAPLKSTIIEEAARRLSTERITTPHRLLERARDPCLRAMWTGLPGQASGATWRHLLLAAGHHEPMVCPLTRRFLRRYLPSFANRASDSEVLALAHEVARTLAAPVLDVDHQMWRAGARGRPQEEPAATMAQRLGLGT